MNDCYQELGITHDCSDAEVKAAWRRLAARWHPDRNDSPTALRKIQRINRALEEIRKSRRMAAKDNGAGSGAGAPPASSTQGEADAAAGEPSPRTFLHTVALTLEQAWAGCVTRVAGEVVDSCAACSATGVDPQPCACARCGGTGQVRQALWFGWLSASAGCGDCDGRGELLQPCVVCSGSGRLPPRRYSVRVRIPAGIRHGGRLQVTAKGRARNGGAGETLAIAIELLPHAFFNLDEDGTVRCEVPVDGFACVAERWMEVPTPGGLQQMRLRRGHLVYRIKGQGFPAPGGRGRADCLVTVAPLFPQALNEAQEALVQRLINANSGDRVTPAGSRVAAWEQLLAGWEQGLASAGATGGT